MESAGYGSMAPPQVGNGDVGPDLNISAVTKEVASKKKRRNMFDPSLTGFGSFYTERPGLMMGMGGYRGPMFPPSPLWRWHFPQLAAK